MSEDGVIVVDWEKVHQQIYERQEELKRQGRQKIYIHTKIRTATYARLLSYMAENGLNALGEVVDRFLDDRLNVAEQAKGR